MTFSPEPRLISFTICPFAQRTRVLLNVKNIAHSIEYIDLENKPDWFTDRVPTGKVPALLVGEETLFESAIINEYLDEISPGSLLPDDPLERAKTRAWISLADDLIFRQYHMLLAQDEADFETEQAGLSAGLAQFADIAAERTAAADVTLIDAALVPVFTRLSELPFVGQQVQRRLNATPQIMEWSERLQSAEPVKASIASDFPAAFAAFFRKRNSYALGQAKEIQHA